MELKKSLNIKGSIVPAYKLNTLFNNIPLIGEILSGNEDEGIICNQLFGYRENGMILT